MLARFLLTLCVMTVALVPAQPAPPPPSPWGVSSSAGSYKTHPEWFPKMAAAGVTSVRLFPEWRTFEPKRDTWNWENGDKLVKAAEENKLEITGILMGSPFGAKAAHTFPIDDLPGWNKYVEAVVGRYKGKIRYWEVWNEGNGGFNGGKHTTSDYATLAINTYDAAKKADPDAKVGLSVASFDAPYLHQTIKAMAKQGSPDRFDFLCIHPYEIAGGIEHPDGEIPFLWMTKMLRDVLKSAAPEKANVEIWISEVGRPVSNDKKHAFSDAAAAKLFAKVYVMAIAQGIARTQWFEGRDAPNEEVGFGLLDRDGKERPAFETLKLLTAKLGTNPKYLGWLTLGKDGRDYGFLFDAKPGPVLVSWMPAGLSNDRLRFANDVEITPFATGKTDTLKSGDSFTLTDLPVLIGNLPEVWVGHARANAGKPFPWGGDFSSAKAVVAEPGKGEANAGLTVIGRDKYPVVNYPDGTAGILVPGDIGHPVTFATHPSFASVLPTDYHVRATVRRVGTGNVGMNLRYEVADSQGKSAYANVGEWYSVPKGEGWVTHTWKVKAAAFSKIWGHDLLLAPEQSVPFVLGKLEVSTVPFE